MKDHADQAFLDEMQQDADDDRRESPRRVTCPTCGQAWETQCKTCGRWIPGCRCGWIDDPCDCVDPDETAPWDLEGEVE